MKLGERILESLKWHLNYALREREKAEKRYEEAEAEYKAAWQAKQRYLNNETDGDYDELENAYYRAMGSKEVAYEWLQRREVEADAFQTAVDIVEHEIKLEESLENVKFLDEEDAQ